jgi:hypothetical protein
MIMMMMMMMIMMIMMMMIINNDDNTYILQQKVFKIYSPYVNIDHPKKHQYKKIFMIIENKSKINDNKAEQNTKKHQITAKGVTNQYSIWTSPKGICTK